MAEQLCDNVFAPGLFNKVICENNMNCRTCRKLDPVKMGRPAKVLPPGVLRKCDCGKEARTVEDLELFTKRKDAPHGRNNVCKDCHNERSRLYRKGLKPGKFADEVG